MDTLSHVETCEYNINNKDSLTLYLEIFVQRIEWLTTETEQKDYIYVNVASLPYGQYAFGPKITQVHACHVGIFCTFLKINYR